MDFSIQPGSGRIGPFWWVNGDHAAQEYVGFCGLAGDPSRHLAWRSGGCGWGPNPLANPLRWHIIRTLN